MKAKFTRITSQTVLSKHLSLDSEGRLQKKTSAQMGTGRAECLEIDSLSRLGNVLTSLNVNQALCYGTTGQESNNLTTKKKWLQAGRPADPIPRSKDIFHFHKGPGVLMVDYDPDSSRQGLTQQELVQAIRSAIPGLQNVSMLWFPSSSSFIHQGDRQLTGLKGQRLYILVQNAADIPRAGAAIVDYLWAKGFGYIQVGKAGQMLERCLVDPSVWQSNRLDFAAGASCANGLNQRRGRPVIIPGETEFIDSITVIPDPGAEIKATADANRAKAKDEIKGEAETVKNTFIREKAREIVGDDDDEELIKAAEYIIKRAVDYSCLHGDFRVQVIEGDEVRTVTVGQILDDPVRFHGLQTLDPLEPDYDGERAVGKIYLYGARPNLYSFAHGGRNFFLIRQPYRIQLVQGRTYDAVLDTLDILRKCPFIFDMGDTMVQVENGQSYPLDQDSLKHCLGGLTQYYHTKITKEGEILEILDDVPMKITREIISLGERRRLKTLKAALSAPTMRPDGSLVLNPGYDVQTEILLDLKDPAEVPSAPTEEQVLRAVDQVLFPFKDFPFVGGLDRAVLLTACLTAAVRATLPTSPAFGIDAPVQGSGKTLMAMCLSMLTTGTAPSVWPHSSGRDDEEIRKRLFAALREGSRVICWDNVCGIFDSASLSSALTSELYQDRILGKSESSKIPNKALFLLTGNNICLGGDLPRRVLKMRLDPKTDRPYAREFDLEPVSYIKTNRQGMIEAALTIIRGAIHLNGSRARGRMASFELWDDLVRQTVCWLHEKTGCFGDPMDAIDEAQAGDPEQESLFDLLDALRNTFLEREVSAKEILNAANGSADDLADAVKDITNRTELPSSKGLGRALTFRMDRIVRGLSLKRIKKGNIFKWMVVNHDKF